MSLSVSLIQKVSPFQFDDWYWPSAATAGDNGALPWGHRPDVSGEAHWIWSHDSDAHDEVRCRYESTHQPIDCPAAQSRYWQDYNDVAAADVAAADVAGSIGMEAWDHFTRYGANSGTIWHSELCNSDGTNKRSQCEVKHTTDSYAYDFLSEPLGDEKTITFSVKAANDAHIGFFNNQEHTGDPRNVQDLYTIDLGAQYEIVISGWGNTQSVSARSLLTSGLHSSKPAIIVRTGPSSAMRRRGRPRSPPIPPATSALTITGSSGRVQRTASSALERATTSGPTNS